ncbi:hypothetical protein BGZ72_005812, partial [Mortierella alpina]
SSKPDMVLEQHSDVHWFTPAKAKAPRGSSRAATSPRRPQRWHQHDQAQAQAPVALAVTSKPVTQHVPAPVSAPDSTAAVDPWSVYGPAFECVASRGARSSNRRLGKEVLRNVPPTCLSPQDSDASTRGWRRIHSQQPQRLGYPSDSAVSAPGAQRNTAGLRFTDLDATSDLEDGSGSDLSYDDELLTLDDAANARMTDQDPSYDGEEEEEDNENDTESDTSDAQSLDESNVATPDFAEDESDSDEGISSEDGDVDPVEESGDSGSHDIDFAYRNDTATQSATSSSHLTSITSSSSSSEDDEDPVDHAYALDPATDIENSVSSRSTIATATASSSSSLHPDSYLDLYGLDLAKCVQTVELDLRLLVWSAEGESVKRILRRLSPFTHLRLVWAGKESPEEMMTGFKVAMDSLHSQIRHLHFFSGFVISPAWTREMAKMTRLHTVTIESLGTLDAIEFDWTRLKCLKLNSVIPRSVLDGGNGQVYVGSISSSGTRFFRRSGCRI